MHPSIKIFAATMEAEMQQRCWAAGVDYDEVREALQLRWMMASVEKAKRTTRPNPTLELVNRALASRQAQVDAGPASTA